MLCFHQGVYFMSKSFIVHPFRRGWACIIMRECVLVGQAVRHGRYIILLSSAFTASFLMSPSP